MGTLHNKILLIDPDDHTRDLVSKSLTREGFRLMEIGGLDSAKTAAEEPFIAAVLARRPTPDTAWYEFVDGLRQNPATKLVPLIVISSKSNIDDECLRRLGVDAAILHHEGSFPANEVKSLIKRNGFDCKLSEVFYREHAAALRRELAVVRNEKEALHEKLNNAQDKRGASSGATAWPLDYGYDLKKAKEEASSDDQRGQRPLRHLEIIFRNTQEEILVLDRSGRVVFFNQTFQQFIHMASGRRPSIGDYLWDVVLPERKEIAIELFRCTVAGESRQVEATLQTPKGEFVHLLKYSPVRENGVVEFVTVISTDITDIKKQDTELKQSEANLRAILESTEDYFTLIDLDFNVVAFNERNSRDVKAISGIELKQGQSVFKTLPANNVQEFLNLVELAKGEKVAKSTTKYVIGGSPVWYEMSMTAVRNSSGKIIGYCITSRDITASKKADLEVSRLTKSLLDFRNAIDRSSIVSIADKDGNIRHVNENFVNISGYSREELVGRNHRMLNSGYHPRSFWVHMWKTISEGRVWRSRVKNRAKDGHHYWVDTYIMPFFNEQGEVIEYLSIRNDITAYKNAEDELVQKQLLLKEASWSAKIGYYVIDTKLNYVSVSPELMEIAALHRSEIHLNVHGVDLDLVEKSLFGERIAGGQNKKIRVHYGDGSSKWFLKKSEFSVVIDHEEKILGTIQDITEQMVVEEVLREYNERFEILSEATNEAIWDLDVKANSVVWSMAISSVFGYKAESFFDRTWWTSKVHVDDIKRVSFEFDKAVNRKSNRWNSTFRFQCADGSYKHVSNRCSILYEEGEPVRMIGSLLDITDIVHAMEEIQKLSLVASKTESGVVITDANLYIEWVNESFINLAGYESDELRDKPLFDLYEEEINRSAFSAIRKSVNELIPVTEEIMFRSKSGKISWLKVEIVPVFNFPGSPRNFISIQTDITEIKEFEQSITAMAEELANLIQFANVPIFGIDLQGRINEWNNVCEELIEYRKEEVNGAMAWQIFDRDRTGSADKLFGRAFEDGHISNLEIPVMTKGGKKIMLLASASVRRNSRKDVVGVIVVAQNITELSDYRNNLELMVEARTNELHHALRKEQESVQLKNQFVSIASHEFRTPLTSISLAAGFMKKYKDKLTPELIDNKVASIDKQVAHMTYLLDDILMVGKAEAGKIPVILNPLEISNFIHDLAAEVEKVTGHSHSVVISESLRYREIMTDEKLLRNIFINLLTNAIKFSPNADVVEVNILTEGDRMQLTVRDFGIGIDEEDQKNIFQPFFRARNANAVAGTGLGLSIIRKAADLLEGSIKLESSTGAGTMFTVILPI